MKLFFTQLVRNVSNILESGPKWTVQKGESGRSVKKWTVLSQSGRSFEPKWTVMGQSRRSFD